MKKEKKMKKTIMFIILGVAAIGFSMNAYAMMGGGRTQSGQTQHMYDSSQRNHGDQEYHNNGRESYRFDHGAHMDSDGRYRQEHFMDDDSFYHNDSHPIDHGDNGYDGRNTQDMHDNGPQGH
jgi:hypothetical protein